MKNMRETRVPVREQAPEIRSRNFDEVCLGYTESEAMEEASRCLSCRHRPCTTGCPVSVRIPEFLGQVAAGDFARAYEIIRATNALPAVCGRVCPQENQCEGKCVRGIKGEPVAIGRLERFVADWARAHREESAPVVPAPDAPRVAVVGSGPAGLACAGDLVSAGLRVTVFEALHEAGGVLVYGIPEFRLPKAIVADEVNELRRAGVEFVKNAVIGRSITVDELLDDEGYDAVFLASGAGLPQFMNIPGEGLSGVYSANEYLTRINLMKAYREEAETPVKRARRVAVIGGGNVAMDAARCARRMGAEEVYIVYRRGEEEMPARREEVHHAKEEGVRFCFLTAPLEVLGDDTGNVAGLLVERMELGAPDESGRRRPVPVEGSAYTLDVDAVIVAVGTRPNPLLRQTTPDLATDRRGCLLCEDGVSTTKPRVFAGGDAVTGAATVILAMGAGKAAAQKILELVNKKV